MVIFEKYLNLVLFCLVISYSSLSVAQNKVVVVPLLGGGSSHEHPELQYLSLAGLAFRPNQNAVNYQTNMDGEVFVDAGTTNGNFFANVNLPDGVTITNLVYTYLDGDSEGDVTIQLLSRPSLIGSLTTITEFQSTGTGDYAQVFASSIPIDGLYNPVDNQNNTYFIRAFLRTGARLRAVKIGYTTDID